MKDDWASFLQTFSYRSQWLLKRKMDGLGMVVAAVREMM
jgi:hypothetical protein